MEDFRVGSRTTPIEFGAVNPNTTTPELQDMEIGQLWRRYKPLKGADANADLVLALIRKLIIQEARNIPYGRWRERLSHPLRTYGISETEWDS